MTNQPEQASRDSRTQLSFGREICGDLPAAEAREWLVTNGVGGFASGTISGGLTRRYHGLLIAALQPPLGRTHLAATLDEIVHYAGSTSALATHHWASGAVAPQGFLFLGSFRLEGTIPVWTYALADALLEKRVWMNHGENTTFIHYTLARASGPLDVDLKALVSYRDFHSLTHAGDWHMKILPVEHGVMVLPFDTATPFYLKSAQASCEPQHEWYRDCFLPVESERGLDDREDHLFAALFHARLNPGGSLTIVITTEATTPLDAAASLVQLANHQSALLSAWQTQYQTTVAAPPEWMSQLVLAADQFVVKRSLPEEPDGRSIIAGYHWFGDWGRDTMIALPGLALVTARPDIARLILLAFIPYVDVGMLPNNFPDAGGKPGYNSVDAALWYFEAVRQYFAATQDTPTLQKLFPVLATIIDAHVAGTRYKIHVDSADGLLYAGGPGVQLTWMDSKIGDWVVTPRTGKPVEINALWINALEAMSQFASNLNKSPDNYARLSAQAKHSFQKFWNPQRSCCFDVIDVPGAAKTAGKDAALRPNQIFAVSLPVSPLSKDQQKSVVDICAQRLLTCYGLRSLAPGEPNYQGHYGGDQRARDSAYHQGTVWGWLLGPFALAHYRAYGDRAAAHRYLEPLATNVGSYGLGTLAEIFDGDPPHTPRGCIAQAWTVAEVLRAWAEIAKDA
ncbi:MAG: amylo-alpha-1,6-glucosidase [Candidatus Acidiferrum sp.]